LYTLTHRRINLEISVLTEGPEDGVLVGGVSNRGAHGEQWTPVVVVLAAPLVGSPPAGTWQR